MPNDETGDLLTATQVGRLINRSGRTVVRMSEAGELKLAAKLPGPNGAHLFRRVDAEALAAKIKSAKASA